MSAPVFRAVDQAAATLPRTLLVVVGLIALVIAPAVRLLQLSTGGAIALYFIVWWTILFAVLPFAAHRGRVGHENGIGADPGAPMDPRLREKAIWTTIWSDLVFLLAVAAFPLAGL